MPLGLPDSITACLFDLDGVLTQTAKVHAAAWKQMFDEYLRGRAERDGEEFVAFDIDDDYDRYVDGKPRDDGVRSFLASRGIELPEGSPDDPPEAETVAGLGNRKNDLVLELIEEQGVEPYEGSVRYVEGGRATPGCAARSSPRAPTAATCSRRRGSSTCSRTSSTAHVAEERGLKGKPAPGHVPRGRRGGSGSSRRAAAVFEDALAGVEAGRAGGFGCVVGVDRVGQADGAARARRRPWSSRTWPSCSTRMRLVDPPARLRGRGLGGPREPTSTSTSSPSRSRSSRSPTATSGCAATSTRASRTGCPGTYLNGVLRGAAAALRRGRLRLPGVGRDGRQRHQRQADPAARRRRAVRHPLRRAAPPRARARPPRRDARARGRVGDADRPAGPDPQHPVRLVRPARDRRDHATRSSRSTGVARVVAAVRAGRQRADPRRRRRPARRPPIAAPLVPEYHAAPRPPRRRSSTGRAASGLRLAAAMEHVVDGPDGTTAETEASDDFARTTVDRRGRRPASRCG